MSVMSRPREVMSVRFCRRYLDVSVPNVGGRKHGRRLIWLLSAGWCRMTKVRRGASSVWQTRIGWYRQQTRDRGFPYLPSLPSALGAEVSLVAARFTSLNALLWL